MDVVPAIRQLESQFSGHDTAAAVRRVTRDSDLHFDSVAPTGRRLPNPIAPCRFSSGDATSPPPNHTRTPPATASTVGSQTTLPSHPDSPAITSDVRSHFTPSGDRA